MKTKKVVIFPKHRDMLEEMGQNIKLARKRRKITTIQLSERANISRSTLFLIEKGDEGVAIGNYFNVLRVMGLELDFLKIASDDVLGKKLQDIELLNNSVFDDPIKRYKKEIRTKLSLTFKKGGYEDNSDLYNIIGCSYNDLISHLNNNKYNFKIEFQEMDVDHIIPLNECKTIDDVKKLNHYTNLQLLPSFYNRNVKRTNKWNEEDFEIWLNSF
jgi:transcriptional regulator with XRE-family HTH domain